jgi:hypothetical protein
MSRQAVVRASLADGRGYDRPVDDFEVRSRLTSILDICIEEGAALAGVGDDRLEASWPR